VTAIKAAVASNRANAQPRLASFLGLWMLEDNVAQARLMFGILLLSTLALAGVLGWQHWQRRRSQSVYVLEDAA
jgi:type III secretion protein J